MSKVYLVIMEWGDCLDKGVSIQVCSTLNKAKEVFHNLVEEEKNNSWIQDYEKEEFDIFDDEDDYFNAIYDDKNTNIYIQETEVL